MLTIPVGVARTPADIDPHVAPLGPASFRERPQEGRQPRLAECIIRGDVHEHADVPRSLGRLRMSAKRPCGCDHADAGENCPPSHSITSSAPVRRRSGNLMARSFAVRWFRTSSNRTGRSTGSSAGERPRSTAST